MNRIDTAKITSLPSRFFFNYLHCGRAAATATTSGLSPWPKHLMLSDMSKLIRALLLIRSFRLIAYKIFVAYSIRSRNAAAMIKPDSPTTLLLISASVMPTSSVTSCFESPSVNKTNALSIERWDTNTTSNDQIHKQHTLYSTYPHCGRTAATALAPTAPKSLQEILKLVSALLKRR